MITRIAIPGATHLAIVKNGDGSVKPLLFSAEWRCHDFIEENNEEVVDIITIGRGIEIDPHSGEDWDEFTRRVTAFISKGNNNVLFLAEHFECSMNDVRDWASGTLQPTRIMRDQAIAFIAREEGR